MAKLTYRGLEIGCQRTVRLDDVAVYDPSGMDRLYRHVTIHVRGYLNPAACAYQGGVPPTQLPGPAGGQGVMGPQTFAQLHDWMTTPRGQLVFTMGGNTVVQSPRDQAVVLGAGGPATSAGMACDLKGGPKPLYFRVVSVHGIKTLEVEFGVETFLDDALTDNQRRPVCPVLSHRWEARDVIHQEGDTNYLRRKVITGLAVFRADVMQNLQGAGVLSPDDFRGAIVVPVEDGLQREVIDVRVSPDGLECRYTVMDRERAVNLLPGTGISDCKIEYYDGTNWGNFNGVTPAAAAQQFAGGNFIGGLQAIESVLPMSTFGLRVRLWGYKSTTRATLVNTASAIIAGYGFRPVNVLAGRIPLPFGRTRTFVDMRDKYVEAVQEWVLSGLAGVTPFALATMLQQAGVITAPYAEDIPVIGNGTGQAPNPGLPKDNGTRAVQVGRLVAQVLADYGQPPPLPVNQTSVPQTYTP